MPEKVTQPPLEDTVPGASTLAEIGSTEPTKALAKAPDEQRRAAAIKRIARIGAATDVFVIGVYLLLYLRTGTWQVLSVAGLVLLALICMALADWLVRHRKLDAAEYVIIGAVLLSYGGIESVLAGLTWYLLLSAIPLILIVSRAVLPRKWGLWLAAAGMFGAWMWLVNQFEPLPRYDATQSITFQPYLTLGLTIVVALTILWQIIRALRIGTLRIRLLIAFVALVVLPIAVTSTVWILSNRKEAQERTISQLESVATLKEAEIQAWLDSLQISLDTALIMEDTATHLLFMLQADAKSSAYYGILKRQFEDVIQRTRRFDALLAIDLQGQVILSTDTTQEGKIYRNEPFFQEGSKGPFVQPPKYFPSLGQTVVLAARPIPDARGQTIGILAGLASLANLNETMLERAGLGESGETYLVAPNHALLTTSRFEGYAPGKTYIHTIGVDTALKEHAMGDGLYKGYRDVPVFGVYHWLPELQVVLLAEQDQAEALHAASQALRLNGAVTIALVLVAVAAGLAVTRSIANPLTDLAGTATRIAGGDLELEAKVEREDEVGTLARVFNRMTAQLRDLIGGLEEQVAQRTRDLARRSTYLEASAEVSRAATSILEPDHLMRQVVELIRERFGLYYVGLFQVDEAGADAGDDPSSGSSGRWAVLRAGTGEAGRAMLARGHRIKVGKGMIGWSIANAQARVASQAETDAVRLVTPELPHTRSEAALPLRSRGRVLGALSVQSAHPEAFDEDLLTALQTMADQVAVALDNARLFAESEAAAEAQRRAYGELSREAWAQLLRAQPDLGFHRDKRGLSPIAEPANQPAPAVTNAGEPTNQQLVRPIKAHDQVIGVVDARKPPEASGWTAEEMALLETVVDQLGLALESARLYQETQRLAHRERVARQITEKVRAAPDVETIARTAAEELVKALGGARGFVKLSKSTSNDK